LIAPAHGTFLCLNSFAATSDPFAVNKALTDLQAAGTIAQLGQAAGLTYLPPREPAILGDVWQQVLHN
jgi:hypothetical protein